MGLRRNERGMTGDALVIVLLPERNSGFGLSRGQNPTFCNSPDPRLLFRFGGLWREYALHEGIHPQLLCVAKRILSRLSFGQLLCLTSARLCCSSKRSAVKNTNFFLLRMPGLMSVSTNCYQPNREGRLTTGLIQVALMDVAAACAAQHPMRGNDCIENSMGPAPGWKEGYLSGHF
jgi:hypothetical protein